MSCKSLESFIILLESGNYKEKQYALSGLLKYPNMASILDIDRVILCLIHSDQAEIVQKIFIWLSHLAVQNKVCKRKLMKNSAIYHLANKILSSCAVKKIIGVLYFFTAVFCPELTVDSSLPEEYDSLVNDAKNKIRTTGILNQMCLLFLQSNIDSAVWPPLCQCICECCTGVADNQNWSSHILPKCLKYLDGNYQLDLINLVISLIHNNNKNREKFVQLEGIQCIIRNLLETPKGLELLCISMTDCSSAVQEAKICNMVQLLDNIYTKANAAAPSLHQLLVMYWIQCNRLQISKWCYFALWIIQDFDEKQKDKGKNESVKKSDNHPLSSNKQMQKNSDISVDNLSVYPNIENSDIETSQKTTLGSSFLSKFDAINSFQFKSSGLQNSVSAVNVMHPYQHTNSNIKLSQDNRYISNQNISFNKNKMKNVRSVGSGRFKQRQTFNNENRNKNKQKSFIYHNNVFNEDKENIFSSKNLFATNESFADFQPKFTSSPAKPACDISQSLSSESLECQNNIFSISMINTSKQKCESFAKPINKGNKSNLNKQTENKIDNTHKNAHSTSFKVRRLVKQVIEMNSKNENNPGDSLNNDSPNTVYYLKPEKMAKNSSNLQKHSSVGNTPIMNRIGYRITVKHRKDDSKKVGAVPKAIDNLEQSRASTLSVASKMGSIFGKQMCNSCRNLSTASFAGHDVKNVIKRLKIGMSLYGCDFQKISDIFWSTNEQMTAIFLYKVFNNHIVKK